MALAIGWAVLFFDAWRIGQPLTLRQGHRRAVVGVNGVLCLSVAGGLLFGAHLVGVQRDFISAMFGDGTVSDAHDGRYNVLLLGGDSGAGRWGLRPDSMTVASIDAETGQTVLVSLPRNMENFPFAKGSVMAEQFPDGFDCRLHLNGVSTWAGDNTELFPGSKNPGVDATIMAIEGITGLKINYWAMVNLGASRTSSTPSAASPSTCARGSRSAASATTSPATSSRASASSTASRRCGTPGPATAPTTTRGWPARSA